MLPTRQEAKLRGDTYFYTGKPCKRGHTAPRYVSSPVCMDCAELNSLKRRPETLAQLKAAYRADPEKYKAQERLRAERDPKRYWVKSAYTHAKSRAEKFGLPFDLTRAYISSILVDECPVFGTSFVFQGAGVANLQSPTLDRLDPLKGYVRGNVAVISRFANNVKSNATSEQVARVAAWMQGLGL